MGVCQSCGMPLAKTGNAGTNQDGSLNEEYCKYCFRDGKFTDEGITLEAKIAKNVEIAKRMGMPEAKAKEMANRVLPALKRWRK